MDPRKPSQRHSLALKCGDCLHFKSHPHPSIGKPCYQDGYQSFTNACQYFTADFHAIQEIDLEAVDQIALLAKDLKPKQLRVLSSVFRQAAQMKSKTGKQFGQPVYVNLSAPVQDYLECWFKARIVGFSQDRETCYLVANLKDDSTDNTHLSVLTSSVLDTKTFKRRKKHMIAEGKEKLPKELERCLNGVRGIRRKRDEEYDLELNIPTLDEAPEEALLAKAAEAFSFLGTTDIKASKKKRGKVRRVRRLKEETQADGTTVIRMRSR